MRLLILGGAGMLGHRLFLDLSAFHDVWTTVRDDGAVPRALPGVDPTRVLPRVDVRDLDRVADALHRTKPDVVVNCVGLIKQRPQANDRLLALEINARFPHLLAQRCEDAGSRLIHISTDCVFSGRRGHYSEDDPPDPVDVYGMTKALGEIVDRNHVLTLRTSLIGRELGARAGLVEWLLAQTGVVTGYRNAVFSGVTTAACARILADHLLERPDLAGVFHLSAAPISKYDLLRMLGDAYGLRLEIEPDDTVKIDRSLDSTRLRRATGYRPPTWQVMIADMVAGNALYAQIRSHAWDP